MPAVDLDKSRDEMPSAFAPYVPPPVKIGAPTKYTPEICERVVELAAQGHTLGAIAAVLGCSKQAFCDWVDRYPAFADAVARAKGVRQTFYESHLIDMARRGGDSTRFNAVRLGLINVAPDEWRERLDTQANVTITLASLIGESMKTIDVTPNPAPASDEKPE